jgi:hypothetical protein
MKSDLDLVKKSSEYLETVAYNGYNIVIMTDSSHWSPKEWDCNVGTISTKGHFCFGEKVSEEELEELEELSFSLPIYMYEHGGATISTTPFSCRWDSGRIGTIWTTEEKLKELGITYTAPEEVLEMLRHEIKVWDTYIQGNVKGFKSYDSNGEELEFSCWGFYDMESLLGAVKGDIDCDIMRKKTLKEKELLEWFGF